jgi:2-succinyl-5-enolpyruvyl-6-hydroxy-3-cyclohexene-1-carboxylate synthase
MMPTDATDTYLLLTAFVDELVRCGMRAACTSPGSRSAPLALTLARDSRLKVYSHIDERCAGFFALGLAKTIDQPVAVTCTSGTAAANLAPAVIEAYEARVPILILTADRPPELRDIGAGQAIDQLKLYGSAAKWFFEVGTHEASPGRLRWIRQLACRAFWTSVEGRPGPVHLNFPLREPLILDEDLPDDDSGRTGERPWVTRPRTSATPTAGLLGGLRKEVEERPRGLIVAGRSERFPGLPAAVARFASVSGYPVIADPLSGCRRGPLAVAHYDALLRDEAFAEDHEPELVIRVGDLPTSKPLRQWLAGLDEHTLQITFDPDGAWHDPAAVSATQLTADPAETLNVLGSTLQGRPQEWHEDWARADHAAAHAIAEALGGGLSEPRIAAELGVRLPPWASVFVASSMPVRDLETFFPSREDPPRVLCNRGANGIDGTISSAFGVAAAGGGPVVALVGDVALTHDIGGLLAAKRLDLALTIVLINNDGGGIFHFLPVATQGEAFVEHVATPHGLDFAHAARFYGLDHALIHSPEGFREALDRSLEAPGVQILEVRTEREANLELHRDVWEAVAAAI